MSDPTKDYNQQHQYGTFQGAQNYPPPPPVIGFPQPVPPSGSSSVNPYVHGYQTVPGMLGLND